MTENLPQWTPSNTEENWRRSFYLRRASRPQQAKSDEKANAALQHLLAARDEVTVGLARAQPGTTQRLKQLYLEFSTGLPDTKL